MSEPQNPNPSPSPAPSDASASPQPPAPSPQASAPSAQAAAAPAKEGSRWTSLALAVAVVTVGGFLLGRAGGSSSAPEPMRTLTQLPPRNVPALSPTRLPPGVLAQRLRDARFRPSTAMQPTQGASLPASPRAMLKAPPEEAVALQAVANVVGAAATAARPRVETCLSKASTQPATATVAYTVHRDPNAGGSIRDAHITNASFEDAQVRQCVVDAFAATHIPELRGTGDLVGSGNFSAPAH
ncbi:MAG: hypothetical protein JST54_23200 [Deltaproteobacteria bacterium]|nr:hypothetical protein [Deltaproteobacteria bacterium]